MAGVNNAQVAPEHHITVMPTVIGSEAPFHGAGGSVEQGADALPGQWALDFEYTGTRDCERPAIISAHSAIEQYLFLSLPSVLSPLSPYCLSLSLSLSPLSFSLRAVGACGLASTLIPF